MASQYAAVGLHGAKNKINVGHVLRAAGCFRASMVAVSGARIYRKALTDTQATYRRIPLLQVEDLRTAVPFDCVPVAVDLLPDATPLERYQHPKRAFYIFGPEDGTLGAAVTDWCRDIVSIPAGCLNLSASVNVVLYDRTAKLLRDGLTQPQPESHLKVARKVAGDD